MYMGDLAAISACRPKVRLRLAASLREVHTPLRVDSWEHHLRSHPEREFVAWLLAGLREGFWIGFDFEKTSCHRWGRNMQSVAENPNVVDDYLAAECAAG